MLKAKDFIYFLNESFALTSGDKMDSVQLSGCHPDR